jgi:thiol-disulfide isomerase/thioredoxin
MISSPTCQPCKIAKEVFAEAIEHGRIEVKMYNENREFCEQYQITGAPTFLVLNSNGHELSRVVGFTKDSKEKIDQILRDLS